MTTKEETSVSSKTSETVTALCKKFEAAILLDAKTGVAPEAEGSCVHDENLPEGLTPALLEDYQKYRTDLIAAAGLALGNLSIEAMAKNKSLEQTETSLRMGPGSTLNMTFDRVRSYVNPQNKDGEKVVKYGVLTSVIEDSSTGKRGQLKIVRDELMATAMERFGK